MVKIMENPIFQWMIWGFSHIFGSTPKRSQIEVKAQGMNRIRLFFVWKNGPLFCLGGGWKGGCWMLQDGFDCRFPYLCIQWLQTQEHVLNLSPMTVEGDDSRFCFLDKHQNQRNKRYIVANRIEAK